MKKSLNISKFKPTDSQEQILQIFPFGGESAGGVGGQSSSDDSELLTGIMMVSVSETSQEDYQTPPEHHSHSQNSTNDPPPPPVDLQLKTDDDDDTEPLGQNIVDLTIDSDHDHLGFTEETYAVHVVEDDHHDSLMVDQNDTQPIETGDGPENLVTDAFETELISSSPPVETADKVFDQMPKKGDVASTSATAAVNATILNRGKRKLPFSMDSKDQTNQDNKGNEAFTSIMDRVLSLLGGMPKHDNATHDADIDLIETAKMRGMTFPRPRWWPPQGSKE